MQDSISQSEFREGPNLTNPNQTKPDYTNQCKPNQSHLIECTKNQNVALILIVYFAGEGRGECGDQSEGKLDGGKHRLWGGLDILWEAWVHFWRAEWTWGGGGA